jgi:H+/Cl- antiporter ClcA
MQVPPGTPRDRSRRRWPGTLAWFAALTAILSLWLYAGPVTPSPGDVVPSIFMGAFFGALLTVLVRSGFQQRPRWDDETLPR